MPAPCAGSEKDWRNLWLASRPDQEAVALGNIITRIFNVI